MNPRKAFENALAKQAAKEVLVKVDWNDTGSIKKAERKKLKLENDGYTLVRTTGGPFTTTLVYRLHSR